MSLSLILLGGLLVFEKWEHKKTIDKLTNALMARSTQDFKEMEAISNAKVVNQTPVQSDLINIGDLSDDEFEKQIINKGVN